MKFPVPLDSSSLYSRYHHITVFLRGQDSRIRTAISGFIPHNLASRSSPVPPSFADDSFRDPVMARATFSILTTFKPKREIRGVCVS